MINVFVYGTLRKGESNSGFLKNAACIAEQCWTDGLLYDSGYGYPAMKQSRGFRTYGELYSVTKEELRRLDQLEGFTPGGTNNLYERVTQTVYTDNGMTNAYVFVAGNADLFKKKIRNDDWKEYNLQSGKNHSVLYFAYGSCMDHKRFTEKGCAHYFQNMVGVGVLANYTLRFTRKSSEDGMGRADVVEEGGIVEGKVYDLPVEALDNYLYKREGAPTAYRPTFVTIEVDGKQVEALTFVVKNKAEETAPPFWYEEEILRGAEGWLTASYISNLKDHINFLRKSKNGGM
ncbi:gamma-glutamylcyclotransferase [Neobacillus sp. SM06]|uniref:gamma-glutamylcyclotransferase n=1 Tax=Neobacillus sp. SM06 TaxID=3422492 RepID=UPI003D2CE322